MTDSTLHPQAPEPDEDDAVPISVRLGTVVPPEDPEDWTQPLTWVAALGMLAGPIVAFGWFAVAPPQDSGELLAGTLLISAAIVLGGALTGATQIGRMHAFAGTLGSALFGALVVIIVGVVMAGQRQVGAASPTLAHAFVGALAGLAGVLVASAVAPALAGKRSRAGRFIGPALIGLVVAVTVARLLL